MPLPHSTHMLLNHLPDCLKRARPQIARSMRCAKSVTQPLAMTMPMLLDARIDGCRCHGLLSVTYASHENVCIIIGMP